MKKDIFCSLVLILALSACGPSQSEIQTQTAVEKTSIAASWTATPTLTPTFTPTPTYTPTLTPTPTKTPLPTATLMGGGQGQIIFVSGDYEKKKYEIFSINSKGGGRKQLTNLGGTILSAVWSPMGDKIVFNFRKDQSETMQLYTMNPDGTDITKISTNSESSYYDPNWSPDGRKIVFMSYGENPSSGKKHYQTIFTMNVDGSNEVQLILDPPKNIEGDIDPSWSPDGTKIAFVSYKKSFQSEIFLINPDGTEREQLTFMEHYAYTPIWSSDGKYIVFSRGMQKGSEIYRMNSDGTDIIRLTKNSSWDLRPKFSPDSTKISWDSCCFNMSVMNLDGTDVMMLYDEWGWGFDWRP